MLEVLARAGPGLEGKLDLTDGGAELRNSQIEPSPIRGPWVEAVANRRDEVEVVGIREAAARRGRNAKREGLCGLPGGETVIERLAQHPDLVAGGGLDPVRDP